MIPSMLLIPLLSRPDGQGMGDRLMGFHPPPADDRQKDQQDEGDQDHRHPDQTKENKGRHRSPSFSSA